MRTVLGGKRRVYRGLGRRVTVCGHLEVLAQMSPSFFLLLLLLLLFRL